MTDLTDLSLIEKYLTPDEMRNIAIEEWRSMCRSSCGGSAERIISNIGHHVARSIVDEALGPDALVQIAAKATEVISNLSEFTVFRKPDAWDRGPSPAYVMLNDALKEHQGALNEHVGKLVRQVSKGELLEIMRAGHVTIEAKGGAA